MLNKECIFCKILNSDIPTKIIAKNNFAIAFLDINPISNGHCLVIPTKHFIDLEHTNDEYLCGMIKLVKQVSQILSCDKTINPLGFNYLSNQGKIAGQVIKHTHIHIIPKYDENDGLSFNVNNSSLKPIDEVYKSILKSIKK